MDNKELTNKAHLVTVNQGHIDFLKNSIEYPFIEIECHGAERTTQKLYIDDKELAKKMFLFLEAEYLKKIQDIKDEMFTLLNNENKLIK